jgi:hypothetical protein
LRLEERFLVLPGFKESVAIDPVAKDGERIEVQSLEKGRTR